MKSINTYITEKFKLSKNTSAYLYHPKTKQELLHVCTEIVKKNGAGTQNKPIDFNCIDTSKINDMSELFVGDDLNYIEYIDISDWNVSNVLDMSHMFYSCLSLKHIGDISNWHVNQVKLMTDMFFDCIELEHVGDLSNWRVDDLENTNGMFGNCEKIKTLGNLSSWHVENITDMSYMFGGCKNLGAKSIGDLNKWNITPSTKTKYMFQHCEDEIIPEWY